MVVISLLVGGRRRSLLHIGKGHVPLALMCKTTPSGRDIAIITCFLGNTTAEERYELVPTCCLGTVMVLAGV